MMVFLWYATGAEPEVFSIRQSFFILSMIIIGGLGSILGSYFGAALIYILPIILGFVANVTGLPISAATIEHLRIMLTGGPRGPGKLAYPGQLIFATDFVAADAYAATLFERDPMSIGHIRLADEAGLGRGHPSRWQAETFEAA